MLLIHVLQSQTIIWDVWTTKKHPALFVVPFTSFWFGPDWPHHHTVVRSEEELSGTYFSRAWV